MKIDRTADRTVPWAFFVLVYVLSIPFFVIGGATGWKIAPGLPVSSLAAFCPVFAAVVLVKREQGCAGVAALLKRALDFARIDDKRWMAPIILIMPFVMIASFVVMRLSGTPVPTPVISIATVIVLFCAAFLAGLGEEIGWSGYAIESMQETLGALRGAVALGLFWAAWHIVPLTQAHRSVEWIAWWCLGTVALRVVMTWLYNHTGSSVFGAALFHAMINVTWLTFPVVGSYYDPRITGLILAGVAALVTIIWGTGSRTLRGERARGRGKQKPCHLYVCDVGRYKPKNKSELLIQYTVIGRLSPKRT